MAFRYPIRIDERKPQPPRIADAIATQNALRGRVRLIDDFGPLRTIAGVDAGYDLERNLTKAVIAVMDYETLTLDRSVIAYADTDFPYISGFLSFREMTAILKALECLPSPPGLLMVDGQGVSHPRRLGIAAHLGVVTNIPAIGVAKSRLVGKFAPLSPEKLSTQPLMDKGERIGIVLQSKEKCNPLFISAGHRVTHDSALGIVKHCLTKYRLPEPTRIADQISKWTLSPATTSTQTSNAKNPPLLTEDLFGSKENV